MSIAGTMTDALARAQTALVLRGLKPVAWEIGAADVERFAIELKNMILLPAGPHEDIRVPIYQGRVRYCDLPVLVVPGARSFCVGHPPGHDPIMTREREPAWTSKTRA